MEEISSDLIRVRPPAAKGRGRQKARVLAFGARAQRSHAGAELVAVGSAALDGLVNEAQQHGRYTIAYAPPPENGGAPPRGSELPRVPGWRWEEPQQAYRPFFLFVYLAEYHTIDVHDDLELIALDSARAEVLSSSTFILDILRMGGPPPRSWRSLPAQPTIWDIRRSLEALDRRLQRRARKVKEAAAIEIARETANIEAYYRQLIDEARHSVGRSQLSLEEEGQRVRTLQLDWKRRVHEVQRFWEAYGDVRLSAIAAVMQPCWAMPLVRERGRRRASRSEMPTAVAEYDTGRLVEPRCAVCGEKVVQEGVIISKQLACRRHSGEAE